jgi:hypothetical protein
MIKKRSKVKKRTQITKNKKEFKKIEKEFVSFGNRKKVFWSITFFTIFLSILGLPLIIKEESFFKRFLVIWILEIIYIGMYAVGRNRKKK